MTAQYQDSFERPEPKEVKRAYISNLPAHVTFDKKVGRSIQPFLKELVNLAKKEGHCFASNGYLAKRLCASSRTVQRWLAALQRAKYIKITLDKKGFGVTRKIYVSKEFQKSYNHDKNVVQKLEDSSSRDKSLSSEIKRTKNVAKSKRSPETVVLSFSPQVEEGEEPSGFQEICALLQGKEKAKGTKAKDIRSWVNHYTLADVKLTVGHVLSLPAKRSFAAYVQTLLRDKFAQNERNMALNRSLVNTVIKEESATHFDVLKKYVIDNVTKMSYMLNLDPKVFKGQIATSMSRARDAAMDHLSIDEYRKLLRENGA